MTMPVEIERKFRVVSDRWKDGVTATRRLCQGYLVNGENLSVRVRIIDGSHATPTVKTARADVSRGEFEYAVPLEDAEALLQLCIGAIIAKVRHIVPTGDLAWEIDVFEAENDGLVIAEIELERPDQQFEWPEWLGEEVTHDRRFYNAALTRHPFTRW
jgi:adenylate cyclase